VGFCQACAKFNQYSQNLPVMPMQPGDQCAMRNWAKLIAAPKGGKVSRREVERLIGLAEPVVSNHQRAVRSAFYAAPATG
jgi:hypothetical protein